MYCVIMAGGKGTRFWPRSRSSRPKQLLDIVGEHTMIQETVARVLPLAPAEKILIVTGREHAGDLQAQVPQIPERNIIVEPFGRNTAPCICLAALRIAQEAPDETMVVLPADHHIGDPEAFRRYVVAACEAARTTQCLITMGIAPARPETGYGYIQFAEAAGSYGAEQFYKVKAFHEKPTLENAELFLSKGSFLWNSGMFIWSIAAILAAAEKHLPEMYTELKKIALRLTAPDASRAIGEAYERIESISIDYGIIEHAQNVLTVKGDFGWNDIGSWTAIYDVAAKDASGNALKGPALSIDARNNLVHAPHKLVALVGVEDLVVVDTPDALLVCARDKAQDVKKIVEALEQQGRKELL
ncbi:mannose-1-phosphate guanylyltransferase [Thermodesulfobacteriota bacterium]